MTEQSHKRAILMQGLIVKCWPPILTMSQCGLFGLFSVVKEVKNLSIAYISTRKVFTEM